MLLKVGELAKRSGLTVRALHHYDSIGLLVPSVRTEAGYRLYNRHDIARLHQIQAMRGLGMSLADIGEILARPDQSLGRVIDQQIHMLDLQITRQMALRDRLMHLSRQLATGEEPDLGEWLSTLELMNMYDRYFSKTELEQLPFYQNQSARSPEWTALVEEARSLMAQSVAVDSEAARSLAIRWMDTLERETAVNPRLFVKLTTMHGNEPVMMQQTGASREIVDFVLQAFTEARLAIYARYLSAEEFAFLRENYAKSVQAWPQLIADLHQAMEEGAKPADPAVQQLARRWRDLFCSFAGTNPQTHQKFRQAHGAEPALYQGTWMTQELQAFLGQALATLSAGAA